MHIAVSGASGLLGSALVPLLTAQGHSVSRLVRRTARAGEIEWDPAQGRLDPEALEGTDAVIHLSGENVGARWTAARKARIRSSRVGTTRLLSETLTRMRRLPAALISASAVGIYGNRGDEILTETSPAGNPGEDFLVSVSQQWEEAAGPARAAGVRVVHPRFGVVLSPAGGALSKMLLPFRLGLGGRLGTGRQWMSWVSIDDAAGAVAHIIGNDQLEGPVNVTAPEPVTNRELTWVLDRVLARPAALPVPALALRLALGEMATGTVLASIRAVPAKLIDAGYPFAHPDLESALRHVLGREHRTNFPQ
ncbi:MAG: TIGR01777 family oxidoreductase [Gemmatimonadales bacterium]